MKTILQILAGFLAGAFAVYLSFAWMAFQFRNPTANGMSFYRNFGSVIRWERMPEFQPQPQASNRREL